MAGFCDFGTEQRDGDCKSLAERGVIDHCSDLHRCGSFGDEWIRGRWRDGGASAATGAPTASLVTTRNNSWVFAVGTDWDRPVARTLGANQAMVHQYLATVNSTYWVQRQNVATLLSGTTVTINDTAPTNDKYDLSLVEICPPLPKSRFLRHSYTR